jgi:hypothetical protein
VLCFLNPPVADRRSRTLTHQKKFGKQNFIAKKPTRHPRLNLGVMKPVAKILKIE